MEVYTLFWLDGRSEVIVGGDIYKALHKAGYESKDLDYLDFWAPGDARDEFEWVGSPDVGNWDIK